MHKNAHTQAIRLRRALLQASSLLLLSILATGLLGQFSAWSISHADNENNRLITQYIVMVDQARSAQAIFKTQVQEWKNTLIRGSNITDRETFIAAFTKSEVDTEAKFSELVRTTTELNLQSRLAEITAAQAEHQALGIKYRQALYEDRGGTFNPAAIDAAVRGMDRHLDVRINILALGLRTDESALIAKLATSSADRYATLSRTLWVLMGVSLLLVATLVFKMLRDHG